MYPQDTAKFANRKEFNMEKLNKDMKGLSYFIGAMGFVQLGNLGMTISEVKKMDITSLGTVDYSSIGVSAETILSIVKVMSVVPSVLCMLALFFLCFKGIKEAKDPSPAKFHIILSAICGVCFAFGAIEFVANLLKDNTDLIWKLLNVLLSGCHAALMFFYFNYARKLRVKE